LTRLLGDMSVWIKSAMTFCRTLAKSPITFVGNLGRDSSIDCLN
jgi:hypothetical protein